MRGRFGVKAGRQAGSGKAYTLPFLIEPLRFGYSFFTEEAFIWRYGVFQGAREIHLL
jgi:hypothetical protein